MGKHCETSSLETMYKHSGVKGSRFFELATYFCALTDLTHNCNALC